MSKRIKGKQPTLAAFGFTKKVKHRDEEIAIQMQLEAVATLFECENCEKFFKSSQASNPKRKFRSSTVLYPLHRKLDSSFENIEISISQA